MKKIVVTLLLALITFTAVLWYRKTSDYRPLEKTLIVGTSADFPPFSFRDKDNTIVGFDIDVVKEVGKRLDMDVDLQDRPFGLLLPQIELGQIHAIAAGMTPTPERAQRVTFTKPYLNENPLLIVSLAKDPVNSLEDLKGKEVVVNTGYTADLYMSQIPAINLIRLPKVADALAALEAGKAYAFATASLTLQPYIKDNKDRFHYYRIDNVPEETSALALSKKLPAEFTERVQKALDAMEADGTLDALKKKWELA